MVIIYSTKTCFYCITLKKFLKSNNIAFKDIDVSKNPEAMEEMVQKSGQKVVPVIRIDNEIIVGFNKARIKEILNIQE